MNVVYYGAAAADPKLRNPSKDVSFPNKKKFKGIDIKGAKDVCLDKQAEQLVLHSITKAHPFPIKDGEEAECLVIAPPLVHHNPYLASNRLFLSDANPLPKTGILQTTLPSKNFSKTVQLFPINLTKNSNL